MASCPFGTSLFQKGKLGAEPNPSSRLAVLCQRCLLQGTFPALPSGMLPAEGEDAALPASCCMCRCLPRPAAEKERARDDTHRDKAAGKLPFPSSCLLCRGWCESGARQGCSRRRNRLVPKPQMCEAHFAWPKTTPISGVEAKLEEDKGPKIRSTPREAGELRTGHFRGFC